jgi:hypothetical protein
MRNNAKSAREKSNPAPRALDHGIAINGELLVQLFGLKVLPVKVRLLVSSKDLAAELGLDWWNDDREASSRRKARSRERAKSGANGGAGRRPLGGNGPRGHA